MMVHQTNSRTISQNKIAFPTLPLIALLALGSELSVEAQSEHTCAVHIVVTRESSSRQAAKTSGTGVLINEGNEIYLATAFHVIHGSKSATLKSGSRFNTSLGTIEHVNSRFYCNALVDLAIFKLTSTQNGGKEYVNSANDVNPIELLPAPSSRLTDPATGKPAIAVGNPRIKLGNRIEFSPRNIVYGCTVSEFARAGDRIKSMIKKKTGFTSEAGKKRLLFIETLSVNKGFSGGPILVESGPTSEIKLAGIVLGGSSSDARVGRFAWACNASAIKQGIDVLEGTISSNNYEKGEGLVLYTSDYESDFPIAYEGGSTYSFDRGYMFENCKFAQPGFVFHHEYKYLFEEGTVRSSQSNEERNSNRVELLFDNVEFNHVSFKGMPLTNATFVNCTFQSTVDFQDSVINGASFKTCTFIVNENGIKDVVYKTANGEEKIRKRILAQYGQPLMAYGVQVTDPIIVTSRDDDPTNPTGPASSPPSIPVAPIFNLGSSDEEGTVGDSEPVSVSDDIPSVTNPPLRFQTLFD